MGGECRCAEHGVFTAGTELGAAAAYFSGAQAGVETRWGKWVFGDVKDKMVRKGSGC